MKTDNTKNTASKVIIVVIAAVIILFPFGYSVVSFVFSMGAESTQPFLEKPDAKYDKCVRETRYMRFHHMDLLKDLRDEFVRDGKRGEVSLANCKRCHTSRERFCDRCHNAVSLYPDCYGCHYYP